MSGSCVVPPALCTPVEHSDDLDDNASMTSVMDATGLTTPGTTRDRASTASTMPRGGSTYSEYSSSSNDGESETDTVAPTPLPQRQVDESECPLSSEARTLIFLDFDDTLYPTSDMTSRGFDGDGPAAPEGDLKAALELLQHEVTETLAVLKKLGTVVILTAAEINWVVVATQRYAPLLYSAMKGLPIISARCGSSRTQDYKIKAMESEIRRRFPRSVRKFVNLISLGDGVHEREAAMRCSQRYGMVSKSLKWISGPSIVELIREHQMVRSKIHSVVASRESLDLCVKVSN